MNAFDTFRSHPWFAKLTQEQLAALAALAKPEHFTPAKTIVRQGDLGNHFFIVDQGIVALRQTDANGNRQNIGVIPTPATPDSTTPPKNYFGDQMFTTQEPYDYRADAVTEVDTFVMMRADFDGFMQAHPEVLDALDFVKVAEKERTHGFRWVLERERVVLVVRKHWWALLPSLIPTLIAVALLVIADFLLGIFFSVDILAIGLPIVLLLSFLWIVFVVYEWYNDEYVVTTQRAVHVERVMIFNETQKAIRLEKILGVRLDLTIPAVWFGVGTLVIQTAGREEGDVTFSHISDPAKVRLEILAQKDRIRGRQAAEESEQFRQQVREELIQEFMPQSASTAPTPAAAVPARAPSLWQIFREWVRNWASIEIYEENRVTWRKHWFLLWRKTRRWLFAMIVLDGLFVAYASSLGAQVVLPPNAFFFGGIVTFGICFLGFLWNWIDWRNDIYAVTDTQVIDEERLPFNLKSVSRTAPLDQVQDVRVDIPGPIAAALNYGNVIIETAGTGGQLLFYMINNPRHAQEEIFRRIEAFHMNRAKQEAALRNRSVIDAIVAYHKFQHEPPPSPPPDSAASGSAAPPTGNPPSTTP